MSRVGVGRWSTYAAVTGAALASATSASAGIIYSGIQNLSVTIRPITASQSGVSFTGAPLFGGAAMPFGILAGNYRSASDSYQFRAAGGFLSGSSSASFIRGAGPFAIGRLASGALVGGSGSFQPFFGPYAVLRTHGLYTYTPSSGPATTSSRSYGSFQNGVTGFAGVRFSQGGQQKYGWIRLRVDDGPGFSETVTAIDWAYNDCVGERCDPSIRAGDAGAVPEPSTTAMALLAAGYAGVMAWRKRRPQNG